MAHFEVVVHARYEQVYIVEAGSTEEALDIVEGMQKEDTVGVELVYSDFIRVDQVNSIEG